MSDVLPIFNHMDASNCCGCEVCVNACPKHAISFFEDGEGFRFPKVIPELCVDCGLCIKKCPQLKAPKKNIELRECLGGFSKNEDILNSSSSGGIFSHIVLWFKKLHPNGKFAGVVWSSDFSYSEYVLTNSLDDLNKIRTAKYIQARKNGIYSTIKQELSMGTPILFAGCPCEVDGLVSYLGEKKKNLYTVDFVCKGSTSERVMREYLSIVSRGKKVSSINLRVVGGDEWIPQWMRITYEGKKDLFRPFYGSILGQAFHYLQREACYKCNHCGENRTSDITLGDFHGACSERLYYNSKGTSILTINTLKGKKVIDGIRNDCVLEPVTYEDILKHNPRIEHAWEKDPLRDSFGRNLSKHGLFYAYLRLKPISIAVRLIVKRMLRMSM